MASCTQWYVASTRAFLQTAASLTLYILHRALAHRRMGFQLRSTSSSVCDVAIASAIGLTASPTSLHAITVSCVCFARGKAGSWTTTLFGFPLQGQNSFP